MDQAQPSSRCQGDKRGNKRAKAEKSRSTLKVKLPKRGVRPVSEKKATNEDKTPGGWTSKPTASRTKTPASRGGDRPGASAGSDVFTFSQQTPSKATNGKKKAKMAVLRTISKMLEENQLIRQRLIALSQAL